MYIRFRGTLQWNLSSLTQKSYTDFRSQVPSNMRIAAHLEYIKDLSSMFRPCSFDSQSSNGSINRLSDELRKQAMHIHCHEEFLTPRCRHTHL